MLVITNAGTIGDVVLLENGIATITFPATGIHMARADFDKLQHIVHSEALIGEVAYFVAVKDLRAFTDEEVLGVMQGCVNNMLLEKMDA